MRLLLVNTLYHPRVLGGAERSVQFLAESYAQLGHEVAVATLTPEPEASTDTHNGVRIHRLPVANFYWAWDRKRRPYSMLWHLRDIDNGAMQQRLGRIIDEERPELVHTNVIPGFSVSAWRAAAQRHIPVLQTLREFYLLCPKSNMFRDGKNCATPCFTCGLFNAQKRRVSALVDGVIGISEHMLTVHRACGFFPNARFQRVIHNSYRAEPREVDTAPRAADRPLRLGYLGQLQEHKGMGVLLEAFARQPAGRVELLLAGSGEKGYENGLREKYPRAQFLGFVKPEVLLDQIDALIVPSLWHEPLGRVALEAYAHGIPVIASKRGGLPELVDVGKTGFLFEPDQPGELDEAISRLRDDPALVAKMRPHCLEKAQSFHPDRIAGLYLEAYDELLSSTASTTTARVSA